MVWTYTVVPVSMLLSAEGFCAWVKLPVTWFQRLMGRTSGPPWFTGCSSEWEFLLALLLCRALQGAPVRSDGGWLFRHSASLGLLISMQVLLLLLILRVGARPGDMHLWWVVLVTDAGDPWPPWRDWQYFTNKFPRPDCFISIFQWGIP